jgi:hypothetical protein
MNRQRTLWWIIGAAVLVLLIAVAIPSINNRDAQSPQLPSAGGTATSGGVSINTATTTTIRQVINNPNNFIGQRVSVAGEIARYDGRRVFVLNELDLANTSLPVVSRTPITQDLDNGTDVIVTGTLERLVVADIERRYDIDLDVQIEADYKDLLILIADTVEILR